MKKFKIDFTITDKRDLNSRAYLLKLSADQPIPECRPGQFAELEISKATDILLRRPISVNFVDKDNNELWLLIQKAGRGTNALANYIIGDIVNIMLPLGNGFPIPTSATQKVLLAGGGVGVAPLLHLGSELKKLHISPVFLLGARTESDLLELEEFQKVGETFVTTEDGSVGEKGFVTQHSILAQRTFDSIYVCGPTPMMKAVAKFAKANCVTCFVSLENKMACGLGACLCCVEDTQEGHKCVCTDGPVFNINDLKWQI